MKLESFRGKLCCSFRVKRPILLTHMSEKNIPLQFMNPRPEEKPAEPLRVECETSVSSSGTKNSWIRTNESPNSKLLAQPQAIPVDPNLTERNLLKPKMYSRRRHVIILGCGHLASEVYHTLLTKRRGTMEVVGFVGPEFSQFGNAFETSQILGTYANLREVVEKFHVRTIVVCIEDRRSVLPVETLLYCKTIGIEVVDGHQMYEEDLGRISIDQLRPSALIFSDGFKRKILMMGLKRAVDVVAAAIGLVLLLPLCLVIGLLIKMDSPGPVFYRQMRVGLYGQLYLIWKFRSMSHDAEKDGPRWAEKHDPRVSRIGRILRKLRIDELPQLYNVLKGEMSLVGPRPERPVFVEELKKKIPYYDIRHTVRPGLTGWAQIRFRYGSSAQDAHTKLQYDLYYVKNMSLGLDIQILTETARVVLFGEGAR